MTHASYINLSAVKCKTAQNAAEELVIFSATETAPKLPHKSEKSFALATTCKR
jgi:hypothetical protein